MNHIIKEGSVSKMSETDLKKIVSKNLNRLMALNNKKQIDLMNDLGLGSSTVSSWCTGLKMPRMDKIQMLADYFGVLKSDLIEDKATTEDPVQINPLTGKKMTKRELSQYEKVMNEATLMFNNEDVSEEDKEKLMMALNDMFWKAKQKNKEKYAKSRKKNI